MKNSHKTYFTVRGYELDSYGHVNNAVYLQYYEQARWEMIRDLGLLGHLKELELSVVVVDSHVRYMRELSLLDEVVIETSFAAESPYLVFYQKIIHVKENLPVSRAKIKTVFIGRGKVPQDIPHFLSSSGRKQL
jgi:YbgC/YbaW family acyl-CoA thioester hydrolase